MTPMTPAELKSAVAKLPRVPLAKLPTPLDELPRLSAHLGIRLWLKRDDLTGLALGGNKTRMLEFLMAEARRQGADVIVAGAAAQSNFCRQLAAACAALGLELHLILREIRGPMDREPQANLLMDLLFGAKVTVLAMSPAEQQERVAAHIEKLRRAGRRPYAPMDDRALAALSYIACAAELFDQLDGIGLQAEAILTAAACETQAGLLAGTRLLGRPTRVIGINPGLTWWDVLPEIRRAGEKAARRLGLDCSIEDADVVNYEEYVGERYGIPTPEGLQALSLMARLEGILLDPVYTSKALAGLLDLLRQGVIERGQSVVMLYTGGVPALFAYTDALAKASLSSFAEL